MLIHVYVVLTRIDGLTHRSVLDTAEAGVQQALAERGSAARVHLVSRFWSGMQTLDGATLPDPAAWFVRPDLELESLLIAARFDDGDSATFKINRISPAAYDTAVADYIGDMLRELLTPAGVARAFELNHAWSFEFDDAKPVAHRIVYACVAVAIARLSAGAICLVRDRNDGVAISPEALFAVPPPFVFEQNRLRGYHALAQGRLGVS